MSRRKQKFPVHLKNEQLEGVDTDAATTSTEEGQASEYVKDARVPVNGQVVHVSLAPASPLSTTPSVIVSTSSSAIYTVHREASDRKANMPSEICLSGPSHKHLTTPLTVTVPSSLSTSIKSAKYGTVTSVAKPEEAPKLPRANSAINLLTTVTNSANAKQMTGIEDSRKERGRPEDDKGKNTEYPYTCPVCQKPFKSKRSFNAHIIVHCQLVNGTNNSSKRAFDFTSSPSPEKKRIRENSSNEQLESEQRALVTPSEDLSLPLDLSCRGSVVVNNCGRPAAASTPEMNEQYHGDRRIVKDEFNHSDVSDHGPSEPLNQTVLSDRGPLEDENENLVNEAREKEKAFFNIAQNEQYLTEDSTGLDPPPPLPLYGAGGSLRRMRVSSDDGPPMVYSVRLYAEQVLVSRILGINEETGDKMELYKCFMCSVAFPSISRLQAHLFQHKQRFVCCKCSFSCDSRVQFSYHVQHEHLSPVIQSCRDKKDARCDMNDDSCSAENTVTVAALLSALREKAQENRPVNCVPKETFEEEEENVSEDSYPVSPSSESQEAGEIQEGNTGGEDLFKMYTCRFCGKKFDRAFSCNRHERVHTGYKPCFCRVCGRGFSEPRNLRHHVIRFHSDGSLRHLIKRDRRKKGEEDSPTPSMSPVPVKYPENRQNNVLKETANKLISNSNIDITDISGKPSGLEVSLTSRNVNKYEAPNKDGRSVTPPQAESIKEQTNADVSAAVTTYTTNLTKIIAASLDNSSRISRRHSLFTDTYRDELEPGEIRLDRRSKIIDDGESGRRLVVTDDQSDEGLDHSPHFSNYAPRLNIVQEPIDRDKALMPITDDIGRTFFECPYCHKLFGSTSDMNRHLDFHEDLRPYNCEYCDYSARTNSQLKVHKMRHEGIKLYSCDVCNYNGVTQSDLNRHKKTQSHVARSQNVCSMCGLGFYTSSQKQVHVVQCHPEVEGASSLIQMSLGPPVAPLLVNSEYSSVTSNPALSVQTTATP